MIQVHQEWKNRKTGGIYEIVGLAICSDNDKGNQPSIIYTAGGQLYTRCEKEFLQKFELCPKTERSGANSGGKK